MSERGDELRAQLLDPMSRRPWLDEEGKSWITVKGSGTSPELLAHPSPLQARLTKEQWLAADAAITARFRERTPLTTWLREQNLVHDMSGTELTQTMQDGLPLPITHADPLWQEGKGFEDFLLYCDIAGKRIGDAVERTLFDGWDGQGAEPKAGSQGYLDELRLLGLTNCGKPIRFGAGVSADDAIKLLQARKFCGPYVMTYGIGPVSYDPLVFRERKDKLPHDLIHEPKIHYHEEYTGGLVSGDQAILQATPDVVRIVLGLEPTLMQWGDGWKVACVVVPQVRCDHHGNVGVAVKRNGG